MRMRLPCYIWTGAALAAVAVAVSACGGSSGPSSVGSSTSKPPVARALVVNSGATNTVREGAEVFLTGRDSEDFDGPLLNWAWAGPSGVDLITRSRTTVSFTAPKVDEPTTLTFNLFVLDSQSTTDRTSIDVQVVPGRDPNRFLAPRAVQQTSPDAFTVTAALVPGASAGVLDEPFTVTFVPSARYIGRSGAEETVELDLEAFAAPLTGTWPAGETVTCAAGQADSECMVASHVSSSFSFQIPRLDIAELNQLLLQADEIGRQIEPHMTGLAVLEIEAIFDAGVIQDQAALIVSAGGNVVADSGTGSIGVPVSVTVSTTDLLDAIGGEESDTTADAYYRTVDPLFRRLTLNQWLLNAGFAEDFNGTLLPEAENGDGDFAHVLYTNNFDLGFGRDMYTRVAPNGDVFAFVVNYPTLEEAIKKTNEIVTVVMEFTPPDDPALHASCLDKSRFVKFFTFAPNQRGDSERIGSMNFDGRGERPTPGNCVTCHGGTTANLDELVPNPLGGAPLFRDCGDTNATFMPWDLDSFLYSDTDPALLNGVPRPDGTPLPEYLDPEGRWTRDAQEEQFRKANAAALATYELYVDQGGDAERVGAAIDLIHGWYGGAPTVAGSEFDGAYTPPGWDVSPEVNAIYHDTFARFCRACHTQLADSSKHFSSYDDFVVNPLDDTPRALEDLLYRRAVMPLARLTMDRFWVPFDDGETPATQLAAFLAEDPRLDLDPTLRPGPPVFSVSITPDPAKEGDLVRVSARDSLFLEDPAWNVLSGTDNGACMEPTLFGATTLDVAFYAPTPGRYCLELTSGDTSTIEEIEVVANQPPEEVVKATLTVDENAGPTVIDLEFTDPDDEQSDLVFTLLGVLNGEVTLDGNPLSLGGTFTQQQIDEGDVRFTPDLAVNLAEGVTAPGGLDYGVTDGIATLGPPSGAPLEYRLTILGVNDGQPMVAVSSVLASELYFGGTVAIGSGKITASDPDNPPAAQLTISVSAADGAITPASLTYQQLLSGTSFTYTHSGEFPIDLSDQVSVTVSDGALTSSPSIMSVNARVSFANNVGRIIDDPSDPNTLSGVFPHLSDDCASCHNSSNPYPTAPTFLNAGETAASWAQVRSRVVLPENACVSPSSPSSALLTQPSFVTPHVGSERPGFDINGNVDGNRDNYDLFRVWICSFGAQNN